MANFVRAGSGPEDALLLHCALADARSLDVMMAKLAGDLSMLAMDLPGHGLSEDWDPSRDYSEMATAMAAGLLERPTHIVGHSFGAYLALRLAVERPELVQSLTLIEPVFFAAAKHSNPAAFRTYTRSARQYMGALAVGDTITAARGFTAIWGAGEPWEAQKPDQMTYVTDRMKLVAAGDAALVEDTGDVWDRLAGLAAPVMLVAGAKSPPVVSAILDGLESQLGDVRRVKLEDTGHMAPLTHPDACADVIRDFVGSQPRSVSIS